MDATNSHLLKDFLGTTAARTAVTPADFLRHAPGRTKLEPGDFLQHLDAARTTLNPADLAQHAPGRTQLQTSDLVSFAGSVRPGAPAVTPAGEDAVLMENAQKWVSQTFFGTLLKQMHNSPFKSDLFSGGRGAEAFSPLYDQHLADRMARASGRKLAESIVRQLKRQKAKSDAKTQTQRDAEQTDAGTSRDESKPPVPSGLLGRAPQAGPLNNGAPTSASSNAPTHTLSIAA